MLFSFYIENGSNMLQLPIQNPWDSERYNGARLMCEISESGVRAHEGATEALRHGGVILLGFMASFVMEAMGQY